MNEVGEINLNSFKLVEVYFMDRDVVYFGICSLSWMESSININCIPLVSVVEFYVLADFPSSCSSIIVREVLKCPTGIVGLSISLCSSISFWLIFLVHFANLGFNWYSSLTFNISFDILRLSIPFFLFSFFHFPIFFFSAFLGVSRTIFRIPL